MKLHSELIREDATVLKLVRDSAELDLEIAVAARRTANIPCQVNRGAMLYNPVFS